MLALVLIPHLTSAVELTPAEMEQLENGEVIIRNKKIKGAPWPELTLFCIIKATPEECAAILSDYPNQKNFTQDLMEVTIRKQISPIRKIVSFTTNVPWPAANDKTVTDNQLSLSTNGIYQVKWFMVESTSLKINRGFARFSPRGGDYTLYCYQTFVHPKSALAGMVKKRMINKVLKAVRSFAKYVEQLKARTRPLLKKSIRAMKEALNAEDGENQRFKDSGGKNEICSYPAFLQYPYWRDHDRKSYIVNGR